MFAPTTSPRTFTSETLNSSEAKDADHHTETSSFSTTMADERTAPSLDPFHQRFGSLPLPRGLREEAEGMDWSLFRTIYSPEPFLTISHLESSAGRFGAELTCYSKTRPPRIHFREVEASGPMSACTAILAAEGCPVEVLSFHQVPICQATATIVQAHHGTRTAWAIGFGATNDASIAHAMSCAATRLHG